MFKVFKKNNNSNLIDENTELIEIDGDRSSVEVSNNKKLPIKQIFAIIAVLLLAGTAFYIFISAKLNNKNDEVVYEVEKAQKEQYNREDNSNYDISKVQAEKEEKARREAEEKARRELEEEARRLEEMMKGQMKEDPNTHTGTPKPTVDESKFLVKELQDNERLYQGSILLPDSNIASPVGNTGGENGSRTKTTSGFVSGGNSMTSGSGGDFLQGTYFANGSVSKVLNRDYLLPSGTVLACVLRTKVITTYEGLVMCQLSKDIYSDNGKNLLVRAGSILEGTQTKVMMQGQGRVFINWNTIRDRDVLVRIDALGTDTLGASGVPAWVDTHFWKRFGNALLLSFIDDAFAVAQAHANKSISYENVTIGDGFGQGGRMAEMALENSINIPPTAYINQGELINIIVPRNVDFSPVYKNVNLGNK